MGLSEKPRTRGVFVSRSHCDAAQRRLVRGMRDGSVRTNKGQPYKPSVVRKYEEQLRCP